MLANQESGHAKLKIACSDWVTFRGDCRLGKAGYRPDQGSVIHPAK